MTQSEQQRQELIDVAIAVTLALLMTAFLGGAIAHKTWPWVVGCGVSCAAMLSATAAALRTILS